MNNKIEQLSILTSTGLFSNNSENVIYLSTDKFKEIKDGLMELGHHCSKGANYGKFNNDSDKARELGFMTVYINGHTLHFNTIDNLMNLIE